MARQIQNCMAALDLLEDIEVQTLDRHTIMHSYKGLALKDEVQSKDIPIRVNLPTEDSQTLPIDHERIFIPCYLCTISSRKVIIWLFHTHNVLKGIVLLSLPG